MTNPITNKSFYTHKQLRSAYRSLKNNLPCGCLPGMSTLRSTFLTQPMLFDAHFADLKNKLPNHNGLNKERKMKFIEA